MANDRIIGIEMGADDYLAKLSAPTRAAIQKRIGR